MKRLNNYNVSGFLHISQTRKLMIAAAISGRAHPQQGPMSATCFLLYLSPVLMLLFCSDFDLKRAGIYVLLTDMHI